MGKVAKLALQLMRLLYTINKLFKGDEKNRREKSNIYLPHEIGYWNIIKEMCYQNQRQSLG